MSTCIFCRIIKGEIPSKIVDTDEDTIIFLDLKGHPLVVTKKHIENIYSLDDELGAKIMKQAIRVSRALKKLGANGVNLIQNNEEAAGQEVMHFHLHVKPVPMPQEDILDKLKDALK